MLGNGLGTFYMFGLYPHFGVEQNRYWRGQKQLNVSLAYASTEESAREEPQPQAPGRAESIPAG